MTTRPTLRAHPTPRPLAALRPLLRSDPSRKRQGLWGAVLLTLGVTVVRLWYASRLRFCGTPDSCFYLGLAQGLERTGSFRVHFIYDLLLPRLQLPNAGIDYWRPGTSFFLLPAYWLGGVNLASSAAITTLAGVVWAAAAWHGARRAQVTRQFALPCYALALLLPAAWTASLTPDSTLFYGAAVAWFLALFTVQRQGLGQDLLALGCVMVAYLVRNDAVLLAVPLLVVLYLRRRANGEEQGSSPAYSALLLVGFVLALLPMHVVYRSVLGTPFPSGTAQALWMNELSDFNLYGARPTAASLLAQGFGHLVAQRAGALLLIAYRVPAILVGFSGVLFLAGLARPAKPDRRLQYKGLPECAGPLVFALTILLVYGLMLPAIGVFSALRSVVGVLPWVAVLVIAGLRRAVESERLATQFCAALLAVYAVSGVMETRRDLDAKNALGERDHMLARSLEQMGARTDRSVVMTGDPVQFGVTTGFATVPVPGNGLDALGAEARALGVTHVILDTNRLAATEGETARVWRVLGAVRRVRMPEEHLVLLELDRTAP